MIRRSGNEDLREVENKAEELVALTFEVCEKRLASALKAPTMPQIALSAAAMSVQQSVETFLAVTHIPDQPGAEK
jgi:hypothetical protein